jgi:uncharacterized protein YggE
VSLRIPYVIDNLETRLADVLNDLLRRQSGQQVDMASAYFETSPNREQPEANCPMYLGYSRQYRLVIDTHQHVILERDCHSSS